MKKLYIFITIFLTLGLWSCKTKKTIIDKKEVEKEQVVIEEKKTEEKKHSETENEKKEEKSVIDEWMKIESDKIIITDKDGTITEIINPRIDKRKSENKESITDKGKVTETEENTQTESKETTHKEKESDVSEQHTSKGKEPVWLYVVGAAFALVVICMGYYILKKQFGYLNSGK